MLEAVWFKGGKEVCKISPVMNIVCDDNMSDISDIEINDDYKWSSYEEADDFIIRVVK